MASKMAVANRLTFTLTQGSADAFVEAEITTNLNAVGVGSNVALRIIEVGIQWPSQVMANAYLGFSITRQSKTAEPNPTDLSLIVKMARQSNLTTSGAIFVPLMERWQPTADANVLVVESPLYCQLDSANTSASNTINGYMLYEQVKITEIERLALLAQSLGS